MYLVSVVCLHNYSSASFSREYTSVEIIIPSCGLALLKNARRTTVEFGAIFNYLYSLLVRVEFDIIMFSCIMFQNTAQLANLGEPHTSMLNGS